MIQSKTYMSKPDMDVVQFDIGTTYFNRDLYKAIYMCQPTGYEDSNMELVYVFLVEGHIRLETKR